MVFLNGEFLPIEEAKVPVLDRGFIFGDGIYEAIPVYGRRLFRFDEHMARLARNLDKMRMAAPPGLRERDDWLARARRVIAAQSAEDQLLYIQVTRGVAMRDHVMPTDIAPTVFMMSNPFKPVPAEARHQGVACVSARDFRWERGDIKCTSLLGNVLANDSDPDNTDGYVGNEDSLQAFLAFSPVHGTLNFDSATGAFTYTPATGFSGTDSFGYYAFDSDGAFSNFAFVAITIDPAAAGSAYLIADPCHPGETALVVNGSNSNDTILVAPTAVIVEATAML